MKMFTSLFRLTMALLLMSAIVVVQAQSGKHLNTGSDAGLKVKASATHLQKQAPKNVAGTLSSAPSDIIPADKITAAKSDEAIPIPSDYNYTPFETDDITVLALDHNGFISSGRRAPSNGSNYQRAIYLLTPSDMAGANITAGMVINAIGWQVYNTATGSLTGTLNIWLMNTADATFNLGTAWSTTGFTQVHTNAAFTPPITPQWFDVPLTNFNFTGGGLYVAWEFSAVGTPGTVVVQHFVNTTVAGSIINAYSNTALPTTLTSASSRPQTRLGLAGVNDIVGVTAVHTLEKAPIPYGAPVPVGAGLQNISASPVTTNVTLEVRKVSDNSLLYTNVQSVTIPAASYAKVTFTSWTPAAVNDVKYIVFTAAIPGDTWTVNNTKTILGEVNTNLYSGFYVPALATNYGYGTGTGIFAMKYTMTGTGLVTGANLFIGGSASNTGNTVQAVMLDAAGNIVASSTPYVLLATDLGTLVNFPFTAAAVVTNDIFYVGLLQVTGAVAWYPMGCASEVPQRGGTFYTFASTGGTPTEFTLDYKYMIEAQVTQSSSNDVAVASIVSPASGAVGVQNVTINVVNVGSTTQSNIPVTYTYNATVYNGTVPGPLAQGVSVDYTFPTTINPPLGANSITACTALPGDQNTSNDCKSLDFNVFPAFTCEWTIDLYDAYGDGWNGAEMDVIVDGYTLLDNITLAAGAGPATFTFGINTGSTISTVFVTNGDWPEECSYDVINNFGSLEGTSGPTGSVGVPPPDLNLTGNCECEVECPSGALAENEPQIPDLGADVTNGGCNMLPNTPLFTPIASGQTYCGQTNHYTTTTGVARDTDWYRFDATSTPDKYWDLNITCTAEFSLQLLLIDAGADDCSTTPIVASAVTNACEQAVISGHFPSGIYYIWVGPQAGTSYPYGGGPYEYVMSYTGSEVGAPVATLSATSFEKLVPPAGTTSDVLTIGNTSTDYPLIYSATTAGTYNIVIEDNFDSYAIGQLGVVSAGAWTTWGGTPGGADDGYVTTAQSHSPSNSFVVTPNIDQVKLFGDLSSGVYRISFYNYIPTGKEGYFNILSDFTFGTGGYWAVDMYFNLDGSIDVVSNHTTVSPPFGWTPDTWKKVEIIVDLDNDVAEAIYDGQSIYSWPWSEGGSAGTGPVIIDAIDFYGATVDNEMYVDDFKVELAANDWLTINGGLGGSGTIVPLGAPVNLNLGFDATGKAVGTYVKNINVSTNELGGAKNTYIIPVTMHVGYQLTGNVYYGATGTTKPQITSTTVTLTPGTTVAPGAGGSFMFRPIGNGAYTLTGTSTKAWGGLNSPDPTFAQRYILSLMVLTDLQKRAADINLSGTVQSLDVTMIKRRIIGQTYPSWVKPNEMVWDGPFLPGWHGVSPTWIQTGLPVNVSGSDLIQDLRCVFSGDVNGSHTPIPNP